MDELQALKRWTAKGYDVLLQYGAVFEPPDRIRLEWSCAINERSIGSVYLFPVRRAVGVHLTDPIEAMRAALIQAHDLWPEIEI